MTIHSTHSRKELIDLIDIYKLHEGNDYLHNYEDMSKHILARLLWKTIQELHSLSIKDNDLFFFDSLDELKQFVSTPTPNMQIRGKDVLFLHEKIKNLNYYIKQCGYLVGQSNYNSLDDIILDAEFVRQHGSLPSVRRVIKLLNLDVKLTTTFECVMSQRQRKSLQIKEEIKKQTETRFKIKKGSHIIIFE
tara:strand:- start:437 stop:1009 length:573 start_codon:yes stop_codon:yes gene_type:complete